MDSDAPGHHSDRGSQYVSIRYTERLAEAAIAPSVGSRGDSYDNALAETINGLYKAEVVHRRSPWISRESVELATLEWVSWFNHHRLLESIGYIPPAEAEANYYRQLASQAAMAAWLELNSLRDSRGGSVRQLLAKAVDGKGAQRFGPRFLLGEWEDVVDAWQLQTWEDYRDVKRLGRKTRLSEQQRLALWEVFEIVKHSLGEQGLVTRAQMFSQLTEKLQSRRNPPFDCAVVDEAQDIGVAQLRFLAALGGDRPNALFFAGDLGQRIFQTPFSWKSLGVDVRGRSQTLRINYRTSHQIRMQADRLLGPQVSDVDGNVEDRRGTVSVFNGPPPDIRVFDVSEQEIAAVGAWIRERIAEGVVPHEIGIFVRSADQIDRATEAAQASGSPFKVLDEHVETSTDVLSVSTMHLAKGLEFRAVIVMACDDEVIPLQERIESVADDADLQEVYDTERHLLYVACTRARDYLLVTSVDPASEFLDDLRG